MGFQDFLGKEKAGGSSPPVGSQFNSTVSLHLLVDFFSPEVRQGNALLHGVLYPNEGWQAIATVTTFIGVGRPLAAISRSAESPAGCRTGQDREATFPVRP